MRSLHKNKQKIWYALFEKREPIYRLDDLGNPKIDPSTGEEIETGEYTNVYSDPVELWVNLSAGRGSAEADAFGVGVEYDRTICFTEDVPITETTLIWKETVPQYAEDGKLNINSADYRVAAKPAKSLNGTLIAIKRNERSIM